MVHIRQHYRLMTHVGLGKMTVQGCGVELSEAVDLVDAAVDAVADGDVDEAVVGAEGHSRLGTLLGERVQTGTGAASKNDSEDGLLKGATDTRHQSILQCQCGHGCSTRVEGGWSAANLADSCDGGLEGGLGLDLVVSHNLGNSHNRGLLQGTHQQFKMDFRNVAMLCMWQIEGTAIGCHEQLSWHWALQSPARGGERCSLWPEPHGYRACASQSRDLPCGKRSCQSAALHWPNSTAKTKATNELRDMTTHLFRIPRRGHGSVILPIVLPIVLPITIG